MPRILSATLAYVLVSAIKNVGLLDILKNDICITFLIDNLVITGDEIVNAAIDFIDKRVDY